MVGIGGLGDKCHLYTLPGTSETGTVSLGRGGWLLKYVPLLTQFDFHIFIQSNTVQY